MIRRLLILVAVTLAAALAVHATEPADSPSVSNATRVACVGDSITYGYKVNDRKQNCYPAKLAKRLGPTVEVRNFGVNGATALKRGTRPYSEQEAYQDALAFKPQFVVIMLGTNDTNEKSWPGHHDEFVSDYIALIKEFRTASPDTHIWLCTPPPIFRDRGTDHDRDAILKDQIVPKIKEVALQTKCNLIEIYPLFTDKSAMFVDGVHPDAAGAQQMARVIAQEIEPQLAGKAGSK